jgi:DNA polymerase zeta
VFMCIKSIPISSSSMRVLSILITVSSFYKLDVKIMLQLSLLVNNYITRLTRSLNHALAISLRRNPESSSSQFVRAILLVKGVHFYGFHASYAPFLKIYVVDPACVNRAVTILQSGVVMKTRFCAYESHINFPLQFMCDFGLYGCGWIELGEASKRGDDQDTSSNQELESSFKVSPHSVQSRMELEVDTVAFHILNRHHITARNLHHELTIPAPPLPDEPLVLSVRELWEDERRRRQARGLNPTPELPIDPSENSRGKGGEWVAEARWWDEIRKRIERERGKECGPPDKSWEKWVPTTFESIDGLWEDGFRAWKPPTDDNESTDTDQTSSNPFSTSSDPNLKNEPDDKKDYLNEDVDESLLSSQQIVQLVDEVEAEWEKITGGDAILDDDVDHCEEPFIREDGSTANASLLKEPSGSDPGTQRTPTYVKISTLLQLCA